jgi:N-acetylglucosamine kinase-like BadF-type ATPase
MPHTRIAERLSALGLHGAVEIEGDLLAMFHSGTDRPSGCVLVSGTGCVAARISHSQLDLVSDGAGWLLGDAGSGYWIGHMVARAVVASLDGRGPATKLTGLMLKSLHLEATPERVHGRPRVLLDLIDVLYRLRPIELARFAPLAFEAGDAVAEGIVRSAASAMADTLMAVRGRRGEAPVVIGGSVAAAMLEAQPVLGAPLRAVLANTEVIHVSDGLVGAAVLGLRRAGVPVDATVFQRLQESVARSREA